MANVKIGDKGCLEETPWEQGCAAGIMRSLVLGGQGTEQLCRSFMQNTCPFLLGKRRGGGAVCALEEAEQGGRGWRGFSSCLEAVSTLCWCVDPCSSAFPPCQCMTPVPVSAPHVAVCTTCPCVHPHAGACPPVPVHAPHAGVSPWHTRAGMEEQHPRQQESSIVEQWRAVHPYRGRGKTAASVMQSCGPLLYFQTSQLWLGVFWFAAPDPAPAALLSSSRSLGWPALLGATAGPSAAAPACTATGLCPGNNSALLASAFPASLWQCAGHVNKY